MKSIQAEVDQLNHVFLSFMNFLHYICSFRGYGLLFLILSMIQGVDGSEIEGIKPLPWYPENLAWQSNFSRNQLRKNQVLERLVMHFLLICFNFL